MSGQEFTASNGCRVARIATAEDSGYLTVFAPSAHNNQQKGTSTSYLLDMQVDALREFFAAHPESKPWHDAKPGEIWQLTVEGTPRQYAAILYVSSKGNYIRFFPVDAPHVVTVSATAGAITAGRRIWPEPDHA